MKSITYYILLIIIKIKGIKKTYSKSPIDYLALRKNDVYFIRKKLFSTSFIKTYKIKQTKISEIKSNESSNKLLLWIHGGAFISGPFKHHWDTIERISKETNYTIWLCDYPKAPENKINQISDNIDLVYDFANKKYNHNEITLIGDSVGGTLIIALIQRLIIRGCQLPNRLILISPVLNASFDNPLIDKIEKKDPILSKKGVLSAKKMCVGNDSLVNPNISPINGNFISFPMTQLYIAENDITYPDQLLLIEKLRDSRVPHSIFFGKGMPHIWPLLPLMKESKIALTDIINSLK